MSDQSPGSGAPFSTEGCALRLDVGAVDRSALRHRAGIHQRVEQPEPEATARPAVESVVDRRGWPVSGRAVAPAAADLQDMHDPGDHPTVFDPGI